MHYRMFSYETSGMQTGMSGQNVARLCSMSKRLPDEMVQRENNVWKSRGRQVSGRVHLHIDDPTAGMRGELSIDGIEECIFISTIQLMACVENCT